MKRTSCMNCGGSRLEEFLDLGVQPNGNDFPTPESAGREPRFPISMLVCRECWQVQIDEFPSPELLFGDHPYITGLNVPIARHFQALSDRVAAFAELPSRSLVLDIGCNDGSLLRCFAAKGMRTLGVDPCERTAKLALEQNTTVCRTFWNARTGAALECLGLFPDAILSTATFYHIPDLHDFIAGLKAVLRGRGVFVAQCVSLLELLGKNQFDHFYHEHSCIHSIGALRRLFGRHGLRILHVETVDIHGGSFIAYVGLEGHPLKTRESVGAAIEEEERAGLTRIETYRAFADRVRSNARALRELLTQLKSQGKRVFALGSPVKGSTLLNFCGIGRDLVECAVEINPFKIGRLTPGTHLPIVDERAVGRSPDYYLVLTWNFLDYLAGKYRGFLEGGGRFIVPIPEVHIVDASRKPVAVPGSRP